MVLYDWQRLYVVRLDENKYRAEHILTDDEIDQMHKHKCKMDSIYIMTNSLIKKKNVLTIKTYCKINIINAGHCR